MNPIPLVRVSAFVPFLRVLGDIGTPIERRLDESHIPSGLLDNPENLLPLAHLLSFLSRIARAEGIEDLGMRAAAQSHVAGLGLFGRILTQSASLNIALEKASRLIPLYNSGQRIQVDRWQGRARISHRLPKLAGEGRRYANQFTMLMLIDLMRQAAGATWRPSEIHLERGVDDPAIYEGLAVPLRESDTAAVICDPMLLGYPLQSGTALPANGNDVQLLASTAPPGDFIDSIRQVILTYMRNDTIGIETISSVIGLSSRGLQRRLRERGLDYSEIVAATRLALARRLLEDRGIAVTDIAQELGYSDAANFTRAFRKWTGLAPSVYRAGLFGES
ncbi:MAG: AraC family transcriptional regulator ligand-binding domain-containing protein [Rhizobiales bacterium]|nr:AraC family transcriptional regulator ligand-binding domain-containing protein [Hyphomicrobiales bacterium]